MEKQVDVYFILIDNPFGTAGAVGESDEGSNEGVPRIVRNQILIRGAPVVARSLTAAGTATMAAGIAIRSQPVKPKRFLAVTARDRKGVLKHQHGKDWRKAWRAEKKRTVHYRSAHWAPQVDVQERRVRRRAQSARNLRATTLQGAGGLLMTAGRLVPTVAAGMVVGSYLETSDGRPVSQVDILVGDVRPDTEGLAKDVGKVHAFTLANVEQAVTLGSAAYYLGKAVKERLT